jgi:hypothetical protein
MQKPSSPDLHKRVWFDKVTFQCLQAHLLRAEAQQEHQEALNSAMGSISGKVELFRSQLHAFTTDARQQLSLVHSDQENTVKRILYRIQQARSTLHHSYRMDLHALCAPQPLCR